MGSAGVAPLGSWMMLPDLTTPATQTVLPSNDALYGAAHVELDLLGPVVVSVPANPTGRYYSVSVMDAQLNNVAHLGPKWTGDGPSHHLIVPPGSEPAELAGLPVIAAPTYSICLYHRVLVGYVPGDLEEVRKWMGQVRITQLSKWGQPDPLPDPVDTAPFEYGDLSGLTDPWEFFRIGMAHLRHNPPPAAATWLLAALTAPELLAEPTEPSLRAAVLDGVADAQDLMDATLTMWPRRNGWMIPKPYLGLPGPHVLEAATFQLFQVGSNDIAESAYYFDDTDAAGDLLDASGGAVYELRFSDAELPDIGESGYWSLTMYDAANNLLVANRLDRYSTRSTRPGFVTGADGEVVILLSHELPPGAPEANWLPAPAGRFRLGLRAYYPGEELRAARWMPPAVQRLS